MLQLRKQENADMKKVNLISALAMTLIASASTQLSAGELCIEIDGIKDLKGTIRTVIVDSKDGFDGGASPVGAFVLPAHSTTMGVCVNGLNEGEYALRIMHDVDGDEELDTNLLGMPSEPWGTSNNAKGSFGPPKWEDARFELGASSLTQNIQLNH